MILIYDDNCPFCCWYSRQFIRFGFLPETGRKAFSAAEPSLLAQVDFEKSRNEIPMVDTATGKVIYGIDALLEILNQKIPFIKKTGNLHPVKWFLKKLYKLISYNRKVIVARKCGPGSFDCVPDMNIKYRLIFAGLLFLISIFLIFPLHNYVLKNLPHYNLSEYELMGTYFAFMMLNGLLSLSLKKENKWIEYIGQLNLLAISTLLILVPLIIINLFNASVLINISYLILTALFLFKEYVRRMDYTGLLIKYKWLVSINLVSLSGFLFYVFRF